MEKFGEESCVSPCSKNFINYIIEMDKLYDVFEKHNLDSVIECMCLATLQEFGQRGIAYDCMKYSVQLAKELSKGIGMENIAPEFQNIYPKGFATIWTSTFSIKIGKQLGFKVLNTVPYTELFYKGNSYDKVTGPVHPKSEQVFMLF